MMMTTMTTLAMMDGWMDDMTDSMREGKESPGRKKPCGRNGALAKEIRHRKTYSLSGNFDTEYFYEYSGGRAKTFGFFTVVGYLMMKHLPSLPRSVPDGICGGNMHAWMPSLFLSQRNFCLRINQKISGVVFRVPREIHSTTNKPHLYLLQAIPTQKRIQHLFSLPPSRKQSKRSSQTTALFFLLLLLLLLLSLPSLLLPAETIYTYINSNPFFPRPDPTRPTHRLRRRHHRLITKGKNSRSSTT